MRERARMRQTRPMVDWVRLGADAEELATHAIAGGKRLGGVLRPMTIQPYRGFVADGVAHVRARVMEKPRIDSAAEGLRLDASIYANLMRWVVLDMPGIEVSITIRGSTTTAVSDKDGFVTAKVDVGDLEPGWHAVELAADDQDGRAVTAQGRVVRPDPLSQVAVISDIDDTILNTGMTEGLRSIRRTLLRDAHGRRPIPGTPSLYRGLARGRGGRPESTFFYVSAAPWNLYDMLVQFLQLRGFPRGPLFMTDWRPGPLSSGEGKEMPGHKQARIRRILDAYPELSFVLIGDDGEADPAIYQEFLKSDRTRIEVAMVRSVEGLASRRARKVEKLRPNASKVLTCADAEHMARIAYQLALVDGLTIEEVQTEMGARL
jgi:phosphatidate phosphatase APP1